MASFSIPLVQSDEPLLFNFTQFKIVNHQDQIFDTNEPTLELIAGDASDRKFFRLLNNKDANVICMQFPKWEGGYGGDPISWIGMHNALKKMHLPVPEILEVDETNACIWTEDLGNDFLNSALKNSLLDMSDSQCQQAIEYYQNALSLLVKAQYPDVEFDHPALNRFFDFEKLYYEMNFFVTNFLNGLLNLGVEEQNKNWSGLFNDFKLLCKKLDNYHRVLCHRDYHARNIMIKDKKVYWIDFQDARMGPHSYDVVSLVRDSYVKVTWKTREHLFDYYLQELNKRRDTLQLKPISYSDFHLESLLMGLQRNVKAIGSFGYLATKKSKPEYLQHVNYTLEILCSSQAQIHEETDLKRLMPNLYDLLESLLSGKYSQKLNKIIQKR